jgi:hypothetical protein
MRHFMLSTFAVIALVSPTVAQERICREPNRLANEFAERQLAMYPNDMGAASTTLDRIRNPEAHHAQGKTRLEFIAGVELEASILFHELFKQHCRSGEIIHLTRQFRNFFLTHCNLTLPMHQVDGSIVCFAQVPPRE